MCRIHQREGSQAAIPAPTSALQRGDGAEIANSQLWRLGTPLRPELPGAASFLRHGLVACFSPVAFRRPRRGACHQIRKLVTRRPPPTRSGPQRASNRLLISPTEFSALASAFRVRKNAGLSSPSRGISRICRRGEPPTRETWLTICLPVSSRLARAKPLRCKPRMVAGYRRRWWDEVIG
jgi:hypothetical protein